MNNVAIPTVEMAVRSFTGSLERGQNSTVQNPDPSDFSVNMEKTPLKTVSSRVDVYVDQDRNDETRNFKNFEDGDIPALKPNCDRQSHAQHNRRQEKAVY